MDSASPQVRFVACMGRPTVSYGEGRLQHAISLHVIVFARLTHVILQVGGAWDVHSLLQGAMMSVRADDDMLAVWCDHNDRWHFCVLR